jgi:hypothetical protein
MAKLVRDGYGWAFHAIGTGLALKTRTDSIGSLLPYL